MTKLKGITNTFSSPQNKPQQQQQQLQVESSVITTSNQSPTSSPKMQNTQQIMGMLYFF